MHILYLHQHFVSRSGSAGGRSYEFSRLLIERGHRVTLISGEYDHSGLSIAGREKVVHKNIDGIELRIVRVPYAQAMSSGERIKSFLRFTFEAARESRRVPRPDVVFATSTPLTIALPGIDAARWHRCPFVFEVRDQWPAVPIALGYLHNPIMRSAAYALERFAYQHAQKIIALSPGMREGIIATGVDEDKVVVIPNSSDVELFRVGKDRAKEFLDRHPELKGRMLVVYAGAFGQVNNLNWLIDLAAEVNKQDRDIAFVLIGHGKEEARLKQEAASRGLAGLNVFFYPPVPRSGLPAVLAAATLLCSTIADVPILEHNSANKFFDAFAAGKPIIINHRGWQADLLEREGAGMALARQDLHLAAKRLTVAIKNRHWMAGAETASRRLGAERFDRRKLARVLEDVLVDAARAGTRRPS